MKAGWAALLSLLGACQPELDDRPVLTRSQLLDPESCKDCHPKHYNEWSGSMHAYAATDPVFIAMNRRGQEETAGELGPFCVNCHAPMAVREGAFKGDFGDLAAVPDKLKGVTCYFCHAATGVREHQNGDVVLADDGVMRAALRSPLQPSTHRVAYSLLHDGNSEQSSALCGACHDIVTPAGVELERTFQEYKQSIFSRANAYAFQSCNGCHMAAERSAQPVAEATGRLGETVPRARDLHEHFWPAVDVPLTDFPHARAMRAAVEGCKLRNSIPWKNVTTRPPLWNIQVALETEAGHMQPSGAAQDRRLWVDIVAYDVDGSELYRMGQIADGAVEELPGEAPHPFMLRDHIYGADGEEVHMFWDAVTRSASPLLLPPTPVDGTLSGGTHTVTRTFSAPRILPAPPARVDVQVHMRPMGIDVLQDLVESGHLAPEIAARMPTFLVNRWRAQWDDAQRQYKVHDAVETDGTCSTYFCMLDPETIGCQ